jgi:hypothetical protein
VGLTPELEGNRPQAGADDDACRLRVATGGERRVAEHGETHRCGAVGLLELERHRSRSALPQGVPNDDFGEEVKAVVQPVKMPAADDAAGALSAELIQFCKSQLADVKCPRSIDFRTELPRHPTGKLYKGLLQDEGYIKMGYDPNNRLAGRKKIDGRT